jgi:flagellar protein FliS
MQAYHPSSDQYLAQRINAASPQQLVALLLEGGQRFLAQARQAMGRKDFAAKARSINRTLAIVEELVLRLDQEQGGELALNLARLYDWWSREILAASATKDEARLDRISRQMGEMRQTWEQLDQQHRGSAVAPSGLQLQDMVG